ncbi:mannose-6-phosphate isomerase, class I [Marisediminicola sp. LYQ134]|uniref:mannose-6-phosphate isomerase, class I n=1 Tax=Marisediminicola sp. LYQ134 TaxID=3391061 RepID=UPI00398319F2
MFVSITNTPRPYAWGSRSAIAELVGRERSVEPEAELWFGAHSGSPSVIVDPAAVGGARTLDEWISADPVAALGSPDAERLPFLLKLLAAEAPLSLQAHPTPGQAREGFARENRAGVPLDAPNRNYSDEFAKPEILVALSETFEAVCGFRELAESRAVIRDLAERAEASSSLELWASRLEGHGIPDGADPLEHAVAWLSAGGSEVDEIVRVLTGASAAVSAEESAPPATLLAARTVTLLAEHHPGDPGIAVALLLNRVTLRRGEALYLPAGNIHAYLHGLGVEIMTASDNVLRGGLTVKHVDVGELTSVLDFSATPPPVIEPERPSEGIEIFRPDVRDFVLARVDAASRDGSDPVLVGLTGPAIALCTGGEVVIRDETTGENATLSPGQASYLTPEVTAVAVSGGELFVAMPG